MDVDCSCGIEGIMDWAQEMNCAVTVCDAEGVIVYMNAPAKVLYKNMAT